LMAIFPREQITYGDLVGLIGSVLLHEPLGGRGRDVRDSGGAVGCFSRHDGEVASLVRTSRGDR
jgi:hypothetical protein